MPDLSARDARAVLDAVAEVGVTTTVEELRDTAARVGSTLLPVERAGWVVIDRRGRRLHGIHSPKPVTRLLERLPDDLAEIPLVPEQLASAGPVSLRISDVMTRTEWHARRIWADLYGPTGSEYQIGSSITRRPEAMHAMSFVRPDRDFSDREVGMAEEFARHLSIASRRIGVVNEPGAELAALTARQREALRSLEDGSTVRQASTRLGITEKTLENHVQEAYRRLGVTNRTAALRALRGGSA